jgi:hypothetical protein
MPKIKNILIFVAIVAVLAFIFFVFVQPSLSNQASLVSSEGNTALPDTGSGANPTPGATPVAQDFLNLLMSVKTITLNDSIFSTPAFISLHDSSITLTPNPADQGRLNPFAPLGTDTVVVPPVVPPANSTTN